MLIGIKEERNVTLPTVLQRCTWRSQLTTNHENRTVNLTNIKCGYGSVLCSPNSLSKRSETKLQLNVTECSVQINFSASFQQLYIIIQINLHNCLCSYQLQKLYTRSCNLLYIDVYCFPLNLTWVYTGMFSFVLHAIRRTLFDRNNCSKQFVLKPISRIFFFKSKMPRSV